MSPVVERIQALFIDNSEKPAQVFQKLGIPKNALSIWKTGKANPSADAIVKISDYFSVSTDYLLTGKLQSSDLCKLEIELLDLFRLLPESNKERVIGYIECYLEVLKDPPS